MVTCTCSLEMVAMLEILYSLARTCKYSHICSSVIHVKAHSKTVPWYSYIHEEGNEPCYILG